MQDEKILMELARLILPSGFVENFKITSIVSNESDTWRHIPDRPVRLRHSVI